MKIGRKTKAKIDLKTFLREACPPFLITGFATFFCVLPFLLMASDGTEAYRTVYPMVNDPATFIQTDYFRTNTLDNGKIWIDKSVGLDKQTFYGTDGSTVINTVTGNTDEFIVTMSAMSQGYDVEIDWPIAVDAVFVIDLSGSMALYGMQADAAPPAGQPTRDVLLVEALNTALDEIMTSSEYSRIAVVGYSGSTTTTFLDLDHYSTGLDGIYFDLNTTGTHNISVNANVINSSGVSYAGVNSNVEGGTNTQMGIVAGGNILEAADTQLNYASQNDGVIDSVKTRRPVLVLMTDGDPTFGWLDFASTTMNSGNVSAGNGTIGTGDIGTDLVTILTGQAVKNRVSTHYVNVQDTAKDNNLSVYTIGVGANSVHAQAVMDPAGTKTLGAAGVNCAYGNGGAGTIYNCSRTAGTITNYNLKTLLDTYVAGNSITFPMLNYNVNNRWGLRTLAYDPTIIDYRYSDEYFAATDTDSLNAAFTTIAGNITGQGGYTTIANADPNLSGYVTITDVIGQYMEVRNFKGVLYEDEMIDGSTFAQVMSPGITMPGGEPNAALIQYAHMLALVLWPSEMVSDGVATPAAMGKVRDAIQGSVAAGLIYYNSPTDFGNVLKVYADSDMEYLDTYYDLAGNVKPAPAGAVGTISVVGFLYETIDALTGEVTDLAYMVVTLDEALEDGIFNMRNIDYPVELTARQQVVRWYVPASLLPTRVITLGCDVPIDISVCPIGSITMDIDNETLPIRLSYTVGLWEDLDADEISVEYDALYGDGEGGWYFYTNDWSLMDGGTGATMNSFEPNQLNTYYYFARDTYLYESDGMGGYSMATDYISGNTYYYQRVYYDIDVPGYRAFLYIEVDPVVTPVLIQTNGVPYIKAKTKRVLEEQEIPKDENITETSDYVQQPLWLLEGTGVVSENGIMSYYLGNNGRIHVGPPTTLTVDKIWIGEPLESVWVQLFKDGVAYKGLIELTEDDGWSGGWDGLFQWKIKANKDGRVSRNTFTVSEGYMDDGTFYIYTSSRPMIGYGIKVTQPVWLSDGTLSDAILENTKGESGVGGNDPEDDWALLPDTGTK